MSIAVLVLYAFVLLEIGSKVKKWDIYVDAHKHKYYFVSCAVCTHEFHVRRQPDLLEIGERELKILKLAVSRWYRKSLFIVHALEVESLESENREVFSPRKKVVRSIQLPAITPGAHTAARQQQSSRGRERNFDDLYAAGITVYSIRH